jgi:hypothetical protein
MSYFIRILCNSDYSIKYDELYNFIIEGFFFDTLPTFFPSKKEGDEKKVIESLTIHYSADKRPIKIGRTVATNELSAMEIKDILSFFDDRDLPDYLSKHINNIKQTIFIDVDQFGLSEEAWFMLDCLESFLANRLDGVIYVSDDGFYDKNLKLIFKY